MGCICAGRVYLGSLDRSSQDLSNELSRSACKATKDRLGFYLLDERGGGAATHSQQQQHGMSTERRFFSWKERLVQPEMSGNKGRGVGAHWRATKATYLGDQTGPWGQHELGPTWERTGEENGGGEE